METTNQPFGTGRVETRSETYERGRLSGETSARLISHDRQFIELRATLERIEALTVSLDKGTQSLADGAKSSANTAIALAAALDKEKVTARETLSAEKAKSDSSWIPYSRLLLLGGGLTGALTLYLSTRH